MVCNICHPPSTTITPVDTAAPSPTTLIFETTAPEDCPVDFMGDSGDIVYFMSLAHSERYGSEHPVSRAAGQIRRRMGIDLAPLLTFGDARTEDEQEERMLEQLWQDAASLEASARAVAEAIEASAELQEMTSLFPELPARLQELAEMAVWAARRGARVRLTYVM